MFSQTRTKSPDGLLVIVSSASRLVAKHTVPVGDVLVCDTRSHVKHDDTALAVDVVSVTETTELLLTCSVPDIELDGAKVLFFFATSVGRMARIGHRTTYGGESERVDFDTERRNVLLLELSSQVALDEGGLGAGAVSKGAMARSYASLVECASTSMGRLLSQQDAKWDDIPFQYHRHRQARA